MYDKINGILVTHNDDSCIMRGRDFDYKVNCSDKVREFLTTPGEGYSIPVYLKHDEKGMELYGFIDESERDMFFRLIKIGGIGCKVALRILSSMTPREIKQAKASMKIRSFCLVPGISEKSAVKIIKFLKV